MRRKRSESLAQIKESRILGPTPWKKKRVPSGEAEAEDFKKGIWKTKRRPERKVL